MTLVADLFYRLRAMFRRREMDAELAAELEHHVATQAAVYESAGMAPRDARRAALMAVGGVEWVKERARDARGISAWDTTMHDFRYAVRGLLRAPSFTIAAVVALPPAKRPAR
jgi:hypothetical protein